VALRFLEKDLRALLEQRGRGDVCEAVGKIGFTDDGGTIYVHLHPREGWAGRAQGRVFVLAWEDYTPDGVSRMGCYRWLVEEARRSLHENPDKIIRWLEGR
jgi:hypothetical protein